MSVMHTARPLRDPTRGLWQILRHPAAFALRVLQGFRANRGLLLGGAVAYYTLLSLVPLLILVVIGLSHFIDETAGPRRARPVPGIRGARTGGGDRRRAARVPRAPGSRRRVSPRDDALLQRAGVLGAGDRDVGDLLPPVSREAPPFPGLGCAAIRLHPSARGRAARRDDRRGRARNDGFAAGGHSRNTAFAGRAVERRCSICLASPARFSC